MSHEDSAGLRKNPRYESHALVEVRTSRWNPFAIESAVLIDLSWDGFKIEFVNPMKSIPPKTRLRFSIPLAPFEISHPRILKLNADVRWFDPRNFRCGGVFHHGDSDETFLLSKVIDYVARKKAIQDAAVSAAGDDE